MAPPFKFEMYHTITRKRQLFYIKSVQFYGMSSNCVPLTFADLYLTEDKN